MKRLYTLLLSASVAICAATTPVQAQKREALAAHKSQQNWLDVSQGLNSYLLAMEDASLELGRMSGKFKHAEGWQRHLHVGFCKPETDPLREILGRNLGSMTAATLSAASGR